MRGDDPSFPLDVRIGERHLHRVRFQEQAKFCKLLKIFHRDGSNLKASPSFGEHETVRRQPTEDLAQGADTEAVGLLQAIQLQLLARSKPAENHVGPNPAVAVIADGFVLFASLDQNHHLPRAPQLIDRDLPRPAPRNKLRNIIQY